MFGPQARPTVESLLSLRVDHSSAPSVSADQQVMAPLPPTHPDGDPFAAQDQQAFNNSALGKLEQRAKKENAALLVASDSSVLDDDEEEGEDVRMKEDGAERSDTASESAEGSESGSEDGDGGGEAGEETVEGVEGEGEDGSEEGSGSEDDSEDDEDDSDDDDDDDGSGSGDEDGSEDDSDDGSDDDKMEVEKDLLNGKTISASATPVLPSAPLDPSQPQPIPTPSASNSPTKKKKNKSKSTLDAPSSPTKPKKKRRQRPLSPPPPVRPPPQTIRLTIHLPRGQKSEVGVVPTFDLDEEAKEGGYNGYWREDEEKEKGKVTGNSNANGNANGEGEGEMKEGEKPKKRRKRKVKGRLGGYDVEDPFVDDSEASLYEPQFYHRPKRDGYHVCSGKLELVGGSKRRGRVPGSKNKPKFDAEGNLIPATRKKAPAVEAGSNMMPEEDIPSVSSLPAFGAGGKALLPLPVSVRQEEKEREKGAVCLDNLVGVDNSRGKKREKGTVSKELQDDLDRLKEEVAKESFEVKNKFPARLRPIVASVSLHALDLGEYDDHYFSLMPKIFPYNLFTMKKLIKREIFGERINRLRAMQMDQEEIILKGVEEGYERQRRDYEEGLKEWEKEGNKKESGEEKDDKMIDLTREEDSPPPEENKEDGNGGAPEPKWRFKFTEPMKMALYNIYAIEDLISDLHIEKQTLEKSTEKEGPAKEKPYSTAVARRAMYAKLVNLWPKDMMTSNHLSREVSMVKKKLDKEKEKLEGPSTSA